MMFNFLSSFFPTHRSHSDLKGVLLTFGGNFQAVMRGSKGAEQKEMSDRIHLYMQHYICNKYHIIEGSLEVKLPTIWTDEKKRWEESERREE